MSTVRITRDLRQPDGTGWQQGVKDGWHVARAFARKVLAYDAETLTFTFAPGPAEPGPWCYNVTGFTNRPDWPAHPDFDGNCPCRACGWHNIASANVWAKAVCHASRNRKLVALTEKNARGPCPP